MSEYSIEKASNIPDKVWDDFVRSSNEGTIFHEQAFLRYHGNRFNDLRNDIVILKGSTLVGLMPMAVFKDNNGMSIAKSPYGASLGGPVFKRALKFVESMKIIHALEDFLRSSMVDRCILTLPTQNCYGEYSETFRLALIQSGFSCVNRDISSVVILKNLTQRMESRARNMVRKAESLGVTMKTGASLDEFWPLLMKTYQRFEKQPTHSYEELQWLITHLPQRISLDIAYTGNIPVASVCSFNLNHKCKMAFYLASDPEYSHIQGLSKAIYEVLLQSEQQGFTCYDFGTSSDRQIGRENIFNFKESFGALGVFREQYQWDKK